MDLARKNTTPQSPEVYCTLPLTRWRPFCDMALQNQAAEALERGSVLYLPQLPFTMMMEEQRFLRADCVKPGVKTIKYSLSKNHIWGMAHPGDASVLQPMLERYAYAARDLVVSLIPSYEAFLKNGNTSFRPVEAAGRAQSKRHDDQLLHIDAFPSRPMQGKRILRVFTNVNPSQSRVWRLGEPFAHVAQRFLPRISPPLPGSSALLAFLSITKGRRSAYDHYMLKLHDRMKLDDAYQREVNSTAITFPPGSTWVVYSDVVSHAAVSGQHALEQTFTLPVAAQMYPESSPLHILEEMKGKRLV